MGSGSRGTASAKPSHLWAFRLPKHPGDPWDKWVIDEALTMIHGVYVGDLDGHGRDSVLTASFEGIHRFDWKQDRWQKVHITVGAPPINDKPGAAAIHQQNGQDCGSENDSHVVQKPEPMGTVVRSVIQRWSGDLDVTTRRLVCDAWLVGVGAGLSFRMRPTVVCPRCNPARAKTSAIFTLPSRGQTDFNCCTR